jgi:thiamine-phosphate pyrophosphorylase
LYVICDEEVCARAGWNVVELASACLDHGARFLQLRAKRAASGPMLQTARAMVQRASGVNASLIVNDRADIARLAGAAGVHVGQEDLVPSAVRGLVGEAALIGQSTHTPEQLRRALQEADPLNYLAVGPVFGTATKATGYAPIGLGDVRRARAAIAASRRPDMPLVAIGGITLDNAPSVIQAGADAVAVITDILTTGDPGARVTAFLRTLGESH